MASVEVLGIDLGKNSCSVVGLDEAGRVVLRRRLARDGLSEFLQKLPLCTVALEACGGAHHWAREIGALGHTARPIPPAYVKMP